MTNDPDFTGSQRAFERALKTVPLASQTFSKSFQQMPQGAAPLFLDRGDGARVWDVDGNEFVDLMAGLLPILLGYRDPDVDAAIRAQLDKGITFSMPTALEMELAERLVNLIPCAQKVRFGKNGTDATSACIRLARAYTGRNHVITMGYHGWQDWYIGATTRSKGVPEMVRGLTTRCDLADLDAFEDLMTTRGDGVAAVMLEPLGAFVPSKAHMQAIRDICLRHGALLVFDEVITGFRVAPGGAQSYFGVTPDLAAFGKAMGNGMPISAVCGRADIMDEMEQIFFSGTFGGESLSLAASIAVIDKIARDNVIGRLWDHGARMRGAFDAAMQKHGLTDVIRLRGLDCWMPLAFADVEDSSAPAIKTVFLREMIRNGVLINASFNASFALSDADHATVSDALDASGAAVAAALARGNIDAWLDIPPIRPVFQARSVD